MPIETWRVGVDVGGTFTDVVAVGSQSGVRVHKTASTPADPSEGVLAGIAGLARDCGLTPEEFLSACTHFMHGTTIATNTLLEGKGANVGMLVTRGFRDAIEIRRGYRENVWDYRTPWHSVLVPRSLRRPVSERTAGNGTVEQDISWTDVDDAIEKFKAADVEAVAVCFMNSYLNDTNEEKCIRYIQDRLPDVFICGSAKLAAVIGEYERSSTAVVNAYIGPRVVPYLRELDARLRQLGLPNRILLVQSNGGAAFIDDIEQRPVSLLLSGPAAGVGALDFFSETGDMGNLITMEIGGTSCDVMLYNNGHVEETTQIKIAGYPAVTASVEVNTVGIGGGTIAYVDTGGMLHVGPRGAGSRPGPACYGLGGTKPTVTDAHVVLGRLQPGAYADGSVNITFDLAYQAVLGDIAKPLGISVEDAAIGILRLAEQNMLHSLEQISSERGINPETLTLVPCGGAGALHGVSVARLLGSRSVFVPKIAGVFCAFGMCNSNVRHDVMQSCSGELSDEVLSRTIQQIRAHYSDLRTRLERNFAPEDIVIKYFLELRYRAQIWTLRVPFFGDNDTMRTLRERFEQAFSSLYGYVQDTAVQIVAFHLVGKGRFPAVSMETVSAVISTPIADCTRRIWIDRSEGFVEAPVFNRSRLFAGAEIRGPALIQEATTTILVGAADTLTVDAAGNYRIQVALRSEQHGR
ncbi:MULTISPECIES: hydantoinase/oxoprolinase family protein [unclassified Mesorhizobium]|uniref:hydantoinase/oxoprolinase family protein n=1 Tax=unclassified Mesorhizobium TaxID=325217 RepID=UPI003336E44C